MRIVGGTHKGRKIVLPKSFSSRPTMDFAREALFNYLNHEFDYQDQAALDLFAGSGALSFELASRGCKKVFCLEINGGNLKALHANRKELNFEDAIRILKQDAFKWINKTEETFDIVIADPPFSLKDKFGKLANDILNSTVLNPGGKLILEHPADCDFSTISSFREERKFGNQPFTIFTKA